MLGTLTRLLLFRVLPRRLFWAVTVVDAIVLARALRRSRQTGRTAIDQPAPSRTPPPGSRPR